MALFFLRPPVQGGLPNAFDLPIIRTVLASLGMAGEKLIGRGLLQRGKFCAVAIVFARSISLALTLVILSCAPSFSGKKVPVAVDGTLDLREWNFEKDGPVTLGGQWEFYWNKFKEDIGSGDRPGLIEPGAWHQFRQNGDEIGSLGYGTYHLTILLPESRSNLSLKTGGYDSAAKLTLEGIQHSLGKPGRTRAETDPIYRQDLLDLPPGGKSISIFVEASNYFHKSGGMLVAPLLGESIPMHSTLQREQLWQGMLAAIFLIFGIYHLLLHIIRRNPVALYFGLYCLFFFVRTLQTGEEVIHVWLPDLDFRIDLLVEYFGLYLFAPVFALFLRALFPDEFPKWARNFFLLMGAIFVPTLLLPPEHYSRFLPGFQIIILLIVISGITTALLAARNKRAGSVAFLLGFVILGMGITTDVLTNILASISTPFGSIGMVGFVLAQAFVIATRFSSALSESEHLSSSLQVAYSEAVELRGRLAQKEKMATIGDMAAGIVHDMKNPVGIIKGSVEMADDDSVTRDERRQMLHIINQEADRMLFLAQDLLDFSQGMVSVNKQELEITAYSQRIQNALDPNFREKQIEFTLNIHADGTLKLDPDRFLRVLVNIASNAADALPPGGKFEIRIARHNGQVELTLSDNGPGIPESIRESLFEPFVTHGKANGTGLGMAIAKSIVIAHGGSISFTTQAGKGTTFTIEVPA